VRTSIPAARCRRPADSTPPSISCRSSRNASSATMWMNASPARRLLFGRRGANTAAALGRLRSGAVRDADAAADRPAADGCFTGISCRPCGRDCRICAAETIRCEAARPPRGQLSGSRTRHPTLDADKGLYLGHNLARYARIERNLGQNRKCRWWNGSLPTISRCHPSSPRSCS
jgi:hypothetical protein